MATAKHHHKVVIIGWDGATYDLIKPWLAQGKLPHYAKFLERACSGWLESTTPHLTYPAWISFLTGKNPGRHGVFDFTERIPNEYAVQFVNARRVGAKTIWRLLSDAGLRVGCMGVPVTYPPEPVNGFLICGFDAPGSGSRTDRSSVHPPELLDEIRTNVGDYITSSNIMPLMNEDRHEEALDTILSTLEMKGKTAAYLLDREPWDCFMALFGESDLVGHHFWRFCDPKSPLYTKTSSERVRCAIELVYRKLDEILGWLLERVDDQTTVLLVSDHGFGGSSDRIVYLNTWLSQQDFLRFKGGATAKQSMAYKVVNGMKNWGLKALPPAVKSYIFRRQTGMAGRMESVVRFGGIDWSQTRAYSEELPYLQTIWINVKGREPGGVVEPGAEYDAVCRDLREALGQWTDPDTGKPVVKKAWHRDELYDGPYVERSPDFLLEMHEVDGYCYQGKSSRQARPTTAIEQLKIDAPGNLKFYAAKAGSHRHFGVVLGRGPGIEAGGTIEGARLWDIAPTLLRLLDQPIPKDMDGRIVDALLPQELVAASAETKYADAAEAQSDDAVPTYSEDEEAVIQERLQGLGYLE